jgi:NADPH:quinone reductase-like Zn-dependent oxidoreductase
MQALRLHEYGKLDHLKLDQIPDGEVGPGQVLIRNFASGVNPIDWKIALGYIQPPWTLPMTLGWDSAGVVEAVGAGVTTVKPGDRVVGAPDFLAAGAHAGHQVRGELEVVLLPETLSDNQAATLPVAGVTAWYTLFAAAKLEAGQAVLIHAAAGAVGVLAIQLAKQAGAYVVATASSPKHDLVRSLGADQVIDYRTTSFENVVRGMDVVLDTLGGEVQSKSYETLKPGGYLVSTVQPPDPGILGSLGINGSLITVPSDAVTLTELVRRAGSGELRTVVDRTLPAGDYLDAYDYSMTQRAQGKIILAWN